jgi:hypothetical protein
MSVLKTILLAAGTALLWTGNAYACGSNAGDVWTVQDDHGWQFEWNRVCSKFGQVDNPNSTFRGTAHKPGEKDVQSELVMTISDMGFVKIIRKDRVKLTENYEYACEYTGFAWDDAPEKTLNAYSFRGPRTVSGTYVCDGMKSPGYWVGKIQF